MLLSRRLATLQLRDSHRQTAIRNFVSEAANKAEEEQQQARSWLARLNPNTFPRNIGEIGFSRSSGPGGQNVNKVNSKATLRVPIEKLEPLLPAIVAAQLTKSPYFARRTDSILIQVDASRKQNDNIEGCWTKLHDIVHDAARGVVKGETSPEQASKVKELKRREDQARMKIKKMQSAKKSSRKSKGSFD